MNITRRVALTGRKAIYVTGAPAAGKSSTLQLLLQREPKLEIWEYGARLTAFLRDRGAPISSQEDLRAQSSRVASPDDIKDLDRELLEWWDRVREHGNVIVDSHPVTKEPYGFRVTPFSTEQIKRLSPDEIWVFYTSPDVTQERIERASGGRPTVSIEEARMHTMTQAAVACTFGIAVGCPVYMFDTNTDQNRLVEILYERLSK